MTLLAIGVRRRSTPGLDDQHEHPGKSDESAEHGVDRLARHEALLKKAQGDGGPESANHDEDQADRATEGTEFLHSTILSGRKVMVA